MKLTVIGAGKMGEAIIAGLEKDFELIVIEKDQKRLEDIGRKYNVKTQATQDNIDIENKNVLLCIKPVFLKNVAKTLSGTANSIVSILAGTSLEELKKNINAKNYIRVMPNLSAAYHKSMTTLTGDEGFKNEAIKICEGFGSALWLESEKEIDIATAVAGSGPAFLALVAESLADGAVKEGLKRDLAQELVCGLFEGFAPLLNDKHPAIIKYEVMSPGGTTAAGISALEEGKARDSFIKAVQKAYEIAKG